MAAKLKTITVGKNVVEIGAKAFINASLTKVTIPAKVRKIGKLVFYGWEAEAGKCQDEKLTNKRSRRKGFPEYPYKSKNQSPSCKKGSL